MVFHTDDRGSALLDALVACAIFASIVVVSANAFGMRPARTHGAAIALEAALLEARSLAAASADASSPTHPTGATVVVERDPLMPGESQISVYRSRPVSLDGQAAAPPPADAGFPPERVSGTISFLGNAVPIREPFAIMLSGGGYASIEQLGGAYDPSRPAIAASDPGCPAAGATIEFVDGTSTESHPFGCTGGMFVAN